MSWKHKANRIVAIALPILLAGALVYACVWGTNATARADGLERSVQDLYRQSYLELNDNVSDMQVALKKLLVVSSSQQHVLLLSDVWRLSGAAATALGAIPQSHVESMDVNRFVVQAGDYAHALSRRILNGEIISEQDREQLYALYEASVSVAKELNARLESDDLPVGTLTADGYYAEPQADAAGGGEAQQGEGAEAQAGGGKSEESASNYPTLIYDGPFSDSTEKAEARGLPAHTVAAADALIAAQKFLGECSLSAAGEAEGSIPVYLFSGTLGDGRAVEIAITKKGGEALWMMTAVEGGEEGVPDETVTRQYRDTAKAYLDARGFSGMEATYAQYYAGTAVLNFAATQDGVLLYADLVKVYIERSSGRVAGVDANNYRFSHTQRNLPAERLTEEEARQSVSDALEVQSTALALIPKTAVTEVLCYEFKGRCRGADFIVYINALTGAEEEVYEVLNSEEGQLVV